MDMLVLKVLTDGSLYLAVFMPFFISAPVWGKAGLSVILAAWAVWLFFNWEKKGLEGTVSRAVFLEWKLLAVIMLFEMVFMGMTAWRQQCAPFALCFFAGSILLLRGSRLQGNGQKRGTFWGVNGLEIFGMLLAAAVLSWKPVIQSFWRFLGILYQTFLLPVIEMFLTVFIKILMWLAKYLSFLFPGVPEKIEMDGEISLDGGVLPDLGTAETGQVPLAIKVLGIGILVFAAFLFFRFLFRRLSEPGAGKKMHARGEVKRSYLKAEDKRISERGFLGGERNVRYYYRKYLKLCIQGGLDMENQSVTSEQVHERATRLWGMEEELEKLRTIYLKIRYGKKKESGSERAKAREIYRKIKEQAEKM
mgnify:FL=1